MFLLVLSVPAALAYTEERRMRPHVRPSWGERTHPYVHHRDYSNDWSAEALRVDNSFADAELKAVQAWIKFLDDVGDAIEPLTSFLSKHLPKVQIPAKINQTMYRAIQKIILAGDELDAVISDISRLFSRNSEMNGDELYKTVSYKARDFDGDRLLKALELRQGRSFTTWHVSRRDVDGGVWSYGYADDVVFSAYYHESAAHEAAIGTSQGAVEARSPQADAGTWAVVYSRTSSPRKHRALYRVQA